MLENNSHLLVAAAQMTSGDNLQQNLATCWHLAEQARKAGAALLALPECFAFLGARERDKFSVAESFPRRSPGPILTALQENGPNPSIMDCRRGHCRTF